MDVVTVVVCVGLTVAQSFALRLLPTPGVIEMFVAFVTCQHSFVEAPASIVAGLATKVTTCGTCGSRDRYHEPKSSPTSATLITAAATRGGPAA